MKMGSSEVRTLLSSPSLVSSSFPPDTSLIGTPHAGEGGHWFVLSIFRTQVLHNMEIDLECKIDCDGVQDKLQLKFLLLHCAHHSAVG